MVAVSACGSHHNKGGVGCCVVTVELIHHIPIFSKNFPLFYHIINSYFVKLDNLKIKATITLMESDKNPMPDFNLFPRCRAVFHFIFDHLQSPGLSDHNRGGGPALDKALYDGPEQLGLDYGTLPE